MTSETRKRCSASARLVFCMSFFACALASRIAHADVQVDTAQQARGTAPRLELELGPQLAWGIGHACRTQPAASVTSVAAESCTSGFAMVGAEGLLLLRPFNHWAFGPVFAYDVVFVAPQVDIDSTGGKGDYARHAMRLAAEVRWYSRKVAPGGLYLGFKAGVLWWSEELDRVTTSTVTQSAPQFAFELGGMFVPYRGFGVTLALQSWLALLRDQPVSSTRDAGSTYGYGPMVFLGLAMRLALSASLR